jgi:hypothetical protein
MEEVNKDNDEEKKKEEGRRKNETGSEVDERMDGFDGWGSRARLPPTVWVWVNFSWSGIILKGNSKITAHYWPET